MSEKRILITEVSGDCRNLRPETGPFDDKPAFYCAAKLYKQIDPKECAGCERAYYSGEPRQDVIKRISQALCAADGGCEKCRYKGNESACKECILEFGYDTLAQSALNAILQGGQNGK